MVIAAQAQGPPPARVVVQQVTRETVAENRSFIGLLEYDRTSRVSSEVAGLVRNVLVREGERVKKGDLLVHLDTEILDREIGLRRTRIEQDQLSIELARKNLDRLEKLLAQMGTSEKNYDDALHYHRDAQLEKRLSEIELEKLLTLKEKSAIKAPFDGVILEKNVETGDWVNQGKQLVALGSTDDTVIRVPVEESLLRFVKVGDRVPLVINAFNRETSGIISKVSPVADPRTKNVSVKVAVPPTDDMVANMTATVHIPSSEPKELSLIPMDALVRFQGNDYADTVSEGNASLLPLNIVTFLGHSVGVDNPDLSPGMPVVTEGNERLRPDQPVTVEERD